MPACGPRTSSHPAAAGANPVCKQGGTAPLRWPCLAHAARRPPWLLEACLGRAGTREHCVPACVLPSGQLPPGRHGGAPGWTRGGAARRPRSWRTSSATTPTRRSVAWRPPGNTAGSAAPRARGARPHGPGRHGVGWLPEAEALAHGAACLWCSSVAASTLCKGLRVATSSRRRSLCEHTRAAIGCLRLWRQPLGARQDAAGDAAACLSTQPASYGVTWQSPCCAPQRCRLRCRTALVASWQAAWRPPCGVSVPEQP